MQREWRLLKIEVADVFTQMAVDEAILQACIEGDAPNTIRFYVIKKPAITIGCNQDFNQLNGSKFDVAKRMTGGTAILHKNDLLYAVIAREQDLPGDIKKTYQYLGRALIRGLNYSGLPAAFRTKEIKKGQDLCYLNDNPFDITVLNKKISGNAQARKKGVILQHGTIILENNYQDLKLLFTPEIVSEYIKKTTYIKKFHSQITNENLCQNLISGFRDILAEDGINLVEGELSEREKNLVDLALGVDKC